MESTTSFHEFNEPIQVDPVIRWEIYYRLLELSIPCSCTTGEPLRVSIQDTLAAVQLWSVMKQTTAPRNEQVEWLNACWGV
ncbi:MAG: Asr1405/Asl0597 family protein [Cyanobacteria bacterium J06627_8]